MVNDSDRITPARIEKIARDFDLRIQDRCYIQSNDACPIGAWVVEKVGVHRAHDFIMEAVNADIANGGHNSTAYAVGIKMGKNAHYIAGVERGFILSGPGDFVAKQAAKPALYRHKDFDLGVEDGRKIRQWIERG